MDKMIKTICLAVLVLMVITLPAAAIQPVSPKITVEGENYLSADIQKTGAEWDSSEEKCPTWRGSDWSGTGDYYLSHGGDTLTYAINIPATGKYVMWMRDWSDTNHAAGDRQITITIDGTTVGTYDAASSFNKGTTGYGWDKFTTVDLGAGSHILTITKKDTTSSAAIIDALWFSTDLTEIPQGYSSHSTEYCTVTTPTTQTLSVEGENYINANVQKTGAEWDSNLEKCPTWRGSDWSGTGDYYLSHGGDTLTYAINIPVAGKYVMWMRDWSDTNHAVGDRQVTIAIDGATIGTFDAASSFNKGTTGFGWDKFTTVDLGAGSHILTITKKDTTSSAAIIDALWFSSDLNEVPAGYISHSTSLCSPTTPVTSQKVTIPAVNFLSADVLKTGAEWDSSEEKCPTWRGSDWSGTGDYYLSHGGDKLTYAINIPATGKYVMWMRDWSDTNHAAGDRQVTITIDGTTIGTYDAASSFNKGTTGYGWDKLTTVDLSSGSHTMTITKKATTSSAAIIDALWFSSDLNEVPAGTISHSTSLCTVTTQTSLPVVYCTAPACDGRLGYTCPPGRTCSGGCGLECITPTPLPKTTTSPMSPAPILGALVICGIIIAVMMRR